jgi:AraC-like DNA-binding protein
MKTTHIPQSILPQESFSVFRVQYLGGSTVFNHHTGWQITLAIRGEGTRFIGDHVEPYGSGDLVLIGPFLPHMWKDTLPTPPDFIIIEFSMESILHGVGLFPELQNIIERCNLATRGLQFFGESLESMRCLMLQMEKQTGSQRFLSFLRLLETMATSHEFRILASEGYSQNEQRVEEKIERVFRYIRENLQSEISRSTLAQIAGMSESAFSRYFAVRAECSYPEHLNKIRIGHACKLLLESDKPITTVCMDCGYTSVPHFNRVFLKLKGVAPREYRARVLEAASTCMECRNPGNGNS